MRWLAFYLLAFTALPVHEAVQSAAAQEPERYTVYCAAERIEISFWDIEQMKVRRGSDVCRFASYTSYSDAIRFADRNFGGEGTHCTC